MAKSRLPESATGRIEAPKGTADSPEVTAGYSKVQDDCSGGPYGGYQEKGKVSPTSKLPPARAKGQTTFGNEGSSRPGGGR